MSSEEETLVPDPLEIRTRRLVVEDEQGRPRAVIACSTGPDPPRSAAVTMRLLTASGDPMIEIRLDEEGEPRLSVGHPDRGAAVIVMRTELQVWDGGNEVAVLGRDTP